MKRSTAFVVISLAVLTVAFGQSTTSFDSRHTYTFNVPASECSQTSGSSALLLESSVIGIQAQIKILVKELKHVQADSDILDREIRDVRVNTAKLGNSTKDLREDNGKLWQEFSSVDTGGHTIICGIFCQLHLLGP